MGIEVEINNEDVQKAVVQAVMDSTVGEAIAGQIKKSFQGYEADRFWKGVVESEVKRVAVIAVREEVERHSDEIRRIVRESIDEQAIQQISARVTEQIWSDK